MSNLKVNISYEFKVSVELTENEIRALDALAGYGHKAFLDVFYKHLGVHYMKPFESNLIELFEKIKTLRPALHAIDKTKKDLAKIKNYQPE